MYPAGVERLFYEWGMVPEAGIPIQVGCVVVNSETALNIYNAAQGNAVTEKYITIAGDIPNRMTVKVPVGTPVMDVLKLSGIEDFTGYSVIDGGPMMGCHSGLEWIYYEEKQGFCDFKDSTFPQSKKTVNREARRIKSD